MKTRNQWTVLTVEGVNSGVPQVLVLRLVVFNLFIKDLESGVRGRVAKFVDNTTLFRMVKTEAGCEEFQGDIHKLCEWVTM